MKLIIPDLSYSCAMCTQCCREKWDIEVEPGLIDELDGMDWSHDIQEKAPYFRKKRSGTWVVNTRKDGGCVFLKGDKCVIHGHLGLMKKPATCIIFPYMFTETPDGVVVGLSYACPAAVKNEGTPLRQEPALSEIAEAAQRMGRISKPKMTLHGKEIGWETYKRLEDMLGEILKMKKPMRHRLLIAHALIANAKDQIEDVDKYLVGADIAKLENDTDTTNPSKQNRMNILATALTIQARDENPINSILGYLKLIGSSKDDGKLPPWRENEATDRYVSHLVFRKSLLGETDICDSYNILILAYAALEHNARTKAAKAGRDKITPEDITESIVSVERRILTHTKTYAIMLKTGAMATLLQYYFKDPDYAKTMLGD